MLLFGQYLFQRPDILFCQASMVFPDDISVSVDQKQVRITFNAKPSCDLTRFVN